MSEITALKLPESTPFPVKILSIDVRQNDELQKHQQILRYSYWEFQDDPTQRIDKDSENDEKARKKVRVDLVGSFDSPLVGVVKKILVAKGDEIISPDHEIAQILEPCTHSIQYSGLCALCGKSLEEEQDYSGYKYEDRATISMSHGTSDLKISKDEAEKVEEKWTKTLINDKKMILVVDLDQTVIHATIDPTINEWMKDPNNPNYPSLKDVQSFSLEEESMVQDHHGYSVRNITRWFYVKSRPGLKSFLENISQKFELHIYTMGTRAYAKKVAQCIDPDGKYFADRILSRDESGSMTQKSLERLFPTDTSMVVIIDDRGDVWNWSDHLIKVVPFDFFVGIGDINSNFLPAQKSLLGPTKRRGSIGKLQDKIIDSQIKPSDQMIEDSKKEAELERKIQEIENDETGDTPSPQAAELSESLVTELTAVRSSEREAYLDAQKEARPMAKLQKSLEELEGEKGKFERLLYDDDNELIALEKVLTDIHSKFYELYDSGNESPDVKDFLPEMKQQVFKGLEFVFSGLFPLESNIYRQNVVIWAKSFGATVKSEITLQTTHIITKSPHTYKAKLAKTMIPDVKIVHPNWVFDCLSNWKHVEETEFEIPISPENLLSQAEVDKYKKKLQEQEEKALKAIIAEPEVNGNDDDELLGGDLNWLEMDDEEDFDDSDEEDEDEENGENGKAGEGEDDDSSKKRSADHGDESESGHSEDEEARKKRKTEDSVEDDEDDEDELAAELMFDLDNDDE